MPAIFGGYDVRGGSRGRVQGVRTPPEMTCGFLRDGPLENLWGGAKYQKNIRSRENEMKKIRARQLTLKNIHAMG